MNVCINIPSIAYANSWLSQTSAISDTTIFTASTEGQYRISVSELVYGSESNSVSCVVWWNPTGGPNANINEAINTSRSGPENEGVFPAGASYVTVLSAGQAVNFETTTTGVFTGYDIYVTIEQLQ